MPCDLLSVVEFLWNAVPYTEVHLVRGLTTERGVGETHIVLIHIERDQLLEPADSVERVQDEQLVLERAPPRFNERVGERDVGLGEKPLEEPTIDQLINGTVEVLNAAVNKEGWLLVDQLPRGAEQ